MPQPSKPHRRRLGSLPGRRLALGAAACLGLVVLPAAGAVADNSAPLVQATVYKAGGGIDPNDSVSADELHANAQCTTYPRATMEQYGRGAPFAQQMVPGDTWTLTTLLSCLERPIPLSSVTGITIIGDDGAPMTGSGSQLTRPDLTIPGSDFQNSDETPVVVDRGSTDEYDRPWRGGSDLNFLDSTQTTPIAIEVFQGPLLTVTATSSQPTVNVGTPVGFSASVTGNNGSPLTYSWNFGGGAPSSSAASPQITFPAAGVWTVNVQVTDANGGGGGYQLTETVNQPGSTNQPTKTGPTATGPNQSSGPTPGGQPTNQKQSGTQSHGKQHTHGKGTHTTSNNTQTTTTQTTTTTQSTTSPAGGPSGGSSGSSAGGSPSSANPAGQATTGHTTPKAPTHRPSPTTRPPPAGTLVRGELVSEIVPLPADRSPLVHVVAASAGGAPARQTPPGRSVLPIAATALAILVLLGLGAQRELGRPRWWPDLRLSDILRIGH